MNNEKNPLEPNKPKRKKLPPLSRVWGRVSLSGKPIIACVFVGLILLVTVYKLINGIPLEQLEILTLGICGTVVLLIFVAWITFIFEPDEEETETVPSAPNTPPPSGPPSAWVKTRKAIFLSAVLLFSGAIVYGILWTILESVLWDVDPSHHLPHLIAGVITASCLIGAFYLVFRQPRPKKPLPLQPQETLPVQEELIRVMPAKKRSPLIPFLVVLVGLIILIAGFIYLRHTPNGEDNAARGVAVMIIGALLIFTAPSANKPRPAAENSLPVKQQFVPVRPEPSAFGKMMRGILISGALLFGGALLYGVLCLCLFPFILFIDESGSLTYFAAGVITAPCLIGAFYLAFRQPQPALPQDK